jgi:hypothetical protein
MLLEIPDNIPLPLLYHSHTSASMTLSVDRAVEPFFYITRIPRSLCLDGNHQLLTSAAMFATSTSGAPFNDECPIFIRF